MSSIDHTANGDDCINRLHAPHSIKQLLVHDLTTPANVLHRHLMPLKLSITLCVTISVLPFPFRNRCFSSLTTYIYILQRGLYEQGLRVTPETAVHVGNLQADGARPHSSTSIILQAAGFDRASSRLWNAPQKAKQPL